MNILLWVLQVLLAAAFLAHGLMFLFPSADMAAAMDASIPAKVRPILPRTPAPVDRAVAR